MGGSTANQMPATCGVEKRRGSLWHEGKEAGRCGSERKKQEGEAAVARNDVDSNAEEPYAFHVDREKGGESLKAARSHPLDLVTISWGGRKEGGAGGMPSWATT